MPKKRELEIINETMEQHSIIVGVLKRRMQSLQVIQSWWSKGNLGTALNSLAMMKDDSITMDVLNNNFAENQKIDSLNYDLIA